MFNDHGQGSGFEIELTDFSAPYNSPLFEDISSIEINHVGETGFNISNATLESSFNASTLNSPFASFGEYGFKMYVIDPSTNGFRQYSLSTAFDTTTATLDGSYDIDTAEAGMQFGFANQHETIGTQRGQSFYTFGTTSNRLRRWFTPTDWDLSTATPDSWIAQSEDVSGWTQTPNLNGGAFFILDRGVGVDMYWLDGANTQIQHWANKLNEIQDVTQAGKAADIDLSTLTNFNWGFPRSMTMADGGNKLIILDDNYNASGNSYLCEIPLNTRNDPSSFSASAPEKVRLLSDIYGTETAYQPHISGYYNEKYFILCGDSTDNVLVFNAAVPAASPLVLNTIDVGSGGDLDNGGSTEGAGYLYLWFPTSGGYWGNDDIGLTYSVTINTGDAVLTPTASTTRTEDNLIETDKFENAYVYEEETKDTLAQIPVYDPFKGILPGNVAQNIKYIRQRDPARYTNASSTRLIDEDLAFDGDQLGQLWWDTSTSAYLYYEQGTDIYRRDNWGKLFPGSSVDIYEWTRHTGTPDSWTGDGTVRNTTDYVQLQEWDPILEEVRTFYYFWVKNRTQVPNGIGRTVAAFEVANIITNPIANLYQWFSPISQSAFMFAGVDNVFTDSNNIFQINYRRTDDERPTHVEWELGRDSDVSYEINDIHWNKMVDSLCGFTDEIDIAAQAYTNIVGSFNTDSSGIDTPGANNITTLTPHGLTNGAGVVYSKNGGTENIGLTEGATYYVEVISDSVFALHAESQQAYPLPPVLVNPATRLPVFTSGAEVHTVSQFTAAPNNFANAIPTAADATRGYLVVPDPALSETQKLGIRTRPMQSMFLNLQDARRVWRNKVNELTNDLVLRDLAPTWNASLTTNNLWEWVDWYADGYDANNTVPVRQVDDTSDLALLEDPLDGDLVKVTGTRYSVYEFDAENDIYNLVAREASRLNILTDVYTSDQSLEIAIEIREIIEALRTNVFTGDLFVYNNSVFFAMLNYVFSEQDDLEWAFKTTYIFLDQTGRTLEQDRVFQEDPFDAALEYITEAKPYHSKVRDFRITRRTATDTAPGTAEETSRLITPFLVYDQIRGGDLSVTEMRIAKYMMSLDTSWKGYTTLYDTDGTSVAVRLGAAGRAVSNYSEVLGDIQGPSGGTKATFDVTIIAGLLANVTLTSPGAGYENGTGFTFNLLTTQGGGDGFAEITYDVVNGQVTNPSVTDGGFGYTNGTNVPVDADDVPTPNVGTTLAEFNPIFTGVATTEDELVAVSVINAAITETFFFDYQGSFLRNTSFGGLPTLESFALASNPTGSGYVVGEILSLDAGSGVPVSNALFRVEQVDGGGGITLLSLVNGGSYTQTPTVDPVNLNGGSGTGAQVTTLIFENGSAVPWDSTPYDQIGFESSSGDDSVTALTGSPDGLATTIPGQTGSDYDGTGENGSFVAGAGFTAGAANSGSPYPSGLTFADNAPALDTISRSDGNSFVATDGMEAGMQIIVSNATEASNNGTYTIDSVTDTVITLATNSQVVDSVSDITATFTFHDVVGMSDGTDVRVDTVDGSGAITQFTIINGSESFLPSNSTITQLSVSGGTGSGFQLTLGEANETSGTFADVPAEETFSGTGNQKEFTILTDTPTFFMFAVVDGVQQVLNVDYFFIGDTLTFVSILDTNGQRAFGAPPAGTDNVELYTYIEAGDLINPQVTAGITEEMVPLDPRENLVLLADTTSVSLTAGGTGYNVNDEIEVVGGTRLQSTIAAQTETDFDGAGSNGTFDGGLGFIAGDTIRLVDTTEITVDTVDGSGTVLTFTIATASGRGFLSGSVINQDSTSNSTTDPIAEDAAEWDTGTGFQLLPGANNEADFGNPMTIRVDTEAANVITGFTVLDQGDYFTYPTSPVSTQTAGAGGAPDSFILAQTTDEDGVAGVTPYQYTSNADQTSWVERAITETDETDANQRYGMAYDGTGTWVSVGEGDLQGDFVTVLESTFTSTDDGVTWVPRTTADQNEMYDVAYGAGLFVAVGFGGDIETSPDGITWTSRTSGVANSLHSIHWTGSEFIAVGEGDILTSANGITWAATATKPGGGSTYFYAVTSNGSRWFVGTDGFGASRTAYYSDNSGATWNLPTGAVAAAGDISGIATDGSSTVVVVGTDGDVLRSTDNGASYTDVTANVGTQEYLNDVIYDYGATSPIGFVVGGWTTYPAGDAFISTSLDGSTWTTRVNTSTTNNGILSLAGKNPVPVAGGSGATFTLASHSFKLHNDTLNNLVFTRNTDSASTTLRSNVGTTDNVIPVAQGENLYTTAPSRQDPQIAWIGTERIVYHGVTATKEATFTIDTDGAGVVSAVALVSGGTGYTDGTGFTFTVTTATGIAGNDDAVIEYDVVGGIVTNPSVNTPGTGYTISQTGVAVSATDTNDPDVAVWELTGVIRGSSGTHPQRHWTGDKVFDGGSDQDIPVSPYIYWVNSATASYATGTNDGEWRYHGNNLVHFVLETAASTIHTTNSIVVGDTLRCTSGSFIQNSYFVKDLIAIGEVSKLDITDAGTGYSKGDVISTGTLDSGAGLGPPTTPASLVIEEVDSNGAILVVSILDRGTGYSSGSLNFVVNGGNGDATITVYTDREGLALAQGGPIISQFGIVVTRNNVSWAADRALPGGLLAATTSAAAFIQAEAGNALPVPAS